MHSDNRSPSSFWLWALLGVLLQLATYGLLRAGHTVGYEHWLLAELARPRGIFLGLVVGAHLVTFGIYRRELKALLSGIARWRVILVVAITAAISVTPSRDIRTYAVELCVGGVVAIVAALGALLLVTRVGERGGVLARWLDADDGASALGPVMALALLVAVVTAALSVVVYESTPHVPDEIVYLLQARYFASGQLTLPAPPVPEAFDIDLMFMRGGRWYTPVPPGWGAILSLGVRAGIPWLVNPLLSGACVVLAYLLARRITNERTARLATLLLAASPWFLFLGMSLMTHASSAALGLAAALGIAVARERSAAWPAALAGIGVGAISLIRPLEGLAVALILGVWSLSARTRFWRLAPSAALTITTVVVGLLTRVYNQAITGDPSVFPIMQYADLFYAPGANDLGFGPNRGLGWGGLDPWPGHGIKDVALNSLLNIVSIQRELFGWLGGSLAGVFGLLLWRVRRLDWALVGIVVFVAAIHSLYWFSGGPDFGARYWYIALFPLAVLTARMPELTSNDPQRRRQLANGIVILTMISMPLFVGWRSVDRYHRYRGMGRSFAQFADSTNLGSGLVLIRGMRHPDYHEAALRNALNLTAPVPVMAWDRTSAIRESTVRAFPTRPVYVVDGPSITGDGYRLVAGPLAPGSLATNLASSEGLPELARKTRGPSAQRKP